MVPCGNPQLLDLLSSGCPLFLVHRSFKDFTNEQVEDMKKIIKLMPRSLLCNIGQARCTQFITPFAMACLNPKVPVTALEYLLKNGAKANSIVSFNSNKIHILTLLKKHAENEDRYNEIKPVLEKYGAVEEIFARNDRYVPEPVQKNISDVD